MKTIDVTEFVLFKDEIMIDKINETKRRLMKENKLSEKAISFHVVKIAPGNNIGVVAILNFYLGMGVK